MPNSVPTTEASANADALGRRKMLFLTFSVTLLADARNRWIQAG